MPPILKRLVAPFRTSTSRIAIGLVAMVTCVILLLDAGLSAFGSREAQARQARHAAAESAATQLTVLMQEVEPRLLTRMMERLLAAQPDLRSLALRRADGSVLAATAHHERLWAQMPAASSDTLRLPLQTGKARWGQAEFVFAPARWSSPLGSLFDVPTLFMIGFLLCGGPAIYFFVRRVLVTLDPDAVIPSRVRSAYDALVEGVVIVDANERIVLANEAFRTLHPDAAAELNGKRLSDLAWLSLPSPTADGQPGWAVAASNATDEAPATTLVIAQPDGSSRHVTMNISAVRDNRNRLKGTLLTFDDHTATERANEQLRAAVSELETSREHIRQQNEKLHEMAHRDSLTGSWNRRAFFEQAEVLFAKSTDEDTPFAVLMTDVDRFKSFNDRFGHAVGDQVLRGVAKAMTAALPEGAVLARYGGEEFCVAAPVDPRGAWSLAEKLRRAVEEHGGQEAGHEVTASFGVASRRQASTSLANLLERADQALYGAKQAGRNRTQVDHTGEVAPVPSSRFTRTRRTERRVDDPPAEPASAPTQV